MRRYQLARQDISYERQSLEPCSSQYQRNRWDMSFLWIQSSQLRNSYLIRRWLWIALMKKVLKCMQLIQNRRLSVGNHCLRTSSQVWDLYGIFQFIGCNQGRWVIIPCNILLNQIQRACLRHIQTYLLV